MMESVMNNNSENGVPAGGPAPPRGSPTRQDDMMAQQATRNPDNTDAELDPNAKSFEPGKSPPENDKDQQHGPLGTNDPFPSDSPPNRPPNMGSTLHDNNPPRKASSMGGPMSRSQYHPSAGSSGSEYSRSQLQRSYGRSYKPRGHRNSHSKSLRSAPGDFESIRLVQENHDLRQLVKDLRAILRHKLWEELWVRGSTVETVVGDLQNLWTKAHQRQKDAERKLNHNRLNLLSTQNEELKRTMEEMHLKVKAEREKSDTRSFQLEQRIRHLQKVLSCSKQPPEEVPH